LDELYQHAKELRLRRDDDDCANIEDRVVGDTVIF
jgi:hypothetical protein